MKFFYMEKWCKRAVILLFCCSVILIIVTIYYIHAAKTSWNYKIDTTRCKKKKGIVEKIYKGSNTRNGRILKYFKLNNGDRICILRKEDGIEEYPDITRKELKVIKEGEEITYLKDEKNKINNYNLCYQIEVNKKVYFLIKEMKNIEKINYILDIGMIIFLIILSITSIGCTIYFYRIADTKDMYIYDD